MKMTRFISSILVLSIIAILYSCHKDDDLIIIPKDIEEKECVFEQIDDDKDGLIDSTERAIMQDCLDNSLKSVSEIEANFIGEWELIGHGEGWVPTISQPCAYITVTEEDLTFKFTNSATDTTAIYGWEIEEVTSTVNQHFRLKTLPERIEGLYITYFCEKYIYGDATPSDGNMYLYEKVK